MDRAENGHGEITEIREHTRVMLQPIAAPSILGLFGFAGATFVVAAHLAGWYGTEKSPEFLFPFAAMFGGLVQFLAGMWAFKARDGIATAMHGMAPVPPGPMDGSFPVFAASDFEHSWVCSKSDAVISRAMARMSGRRRGN